MSENDFSYKTRVQLELDELNIKIDALAKFGNGDVYQTLSKAEIFRLSEQMIAMQRYSEVLQQRIDADFK